MNQYESAQDEFDALSKEFEKYINELKRKWLSQNRIDSRDVYEVMSQTQRAEVHRRIAQWSSYITPLAEAWWKERGYGVTWPADDSKPMLIRKLTAA